MENNKVIKISIVALFVALFITALALLFKNDNTTDSGKTGNTEVGSIEEGPDDTVVTETYANNEYGFRFNYPNLLLVTEYDDAGEYDFFVSFDETKYSSTKGTRIGVNEGSLEQAFTIIENSFEEDYEISEEKRFLLRGHDVLQKIYKIKGSDESKAVAVINNSGLAYSISTSPEQIDAVLDSFEFTRSVEQNCETDINCPSGFICEEGVCKST